MQLYRYVLYNVTIVTRIVVFINLHKIKRARVVSLSRLLLLPPLAEGVWCLGFLLIFINNYFIISITNILQVVVVLFVIFYYIL